MNTIQYINTDLDLRSPHPIDLLVHALSARGIWSSHNTAGDNGNFYSTLEVSTEEYLRHPEATIAGFLDAIESLSDEIKLLWNNCDLREFNIGYDCGEEPWAFNNGFSNAIVTRLANAGATLRITIYPVKEGETPADVA